MDINKISGCIIKRLREEKHIKQETLARELKVSVQTLSAIENGRQNINLSQLEKILKLLEI